MPEIPRFYSVQKPQITRLEENRYSLTERKLIECDQAIGHKFLAKRGQFIEKQIAFPSPDTKKHKARRNKPPDPVCRPTGCH